MKIYRYGSWVRAEWMQGRVSVHYGAKSAIQRRVSLYISWATWRTSGITDAKQLSRCLLSAIALAEKWKKNPPVLAELGIKWHILKSHKHRRRQGTND